MDPRAAAKYLLTLREAADSFRGFVQLLHPEFKLAPFQLELISVLDALERDELPEDNVLITMPPRHAKSTFATQLFPLYYMLRDPRRFVMSCSYNSELATDFGNAIKAYLARPEVAQAFPEFALTNESAAAVRWRTLQGGAYNAVGLGGTTSGRPATLLNLDDPIKSREDAESMSARNKTWAYYTGSLATRLQPTHDGRPPKQLVILTRWHPDDVGGRLQKTEDWKEGRWRHVNFQAITTETQTRTVHRCMLPPEHPEAPQTPEDRDRLLKCDDRARTHVTLKETTERPLWPERFPLEDLKRRQRLNPRDFASLYQQKPYVAGGNMIRQEWWRTYPSDLDPSNFAAVIIAVDTAFKKSETADYSVAMVGGIDQLGDIYILDVLRRRLEFPALKQQLILLNNRWRGRGLRAIYIEDKASGMSLIQALRESSGMAVIPHKAVHDKVARVNAVLPLIEGGRVHLPESAPWLDDFAEECVQFPNGTHDDQVDALSMLLDRLARTSLSPDALAMHVNADLSLRQQVEAQRNPGFAKSLTKALRASKWSGWGM